MVISPEKVESLGVEAHQRVNRYRVVVEELFAKAGITINGSQPYDIQVHNDGFYKRFLRDASLGLGESYMDSWWDCQRIDELTFRIMKANIRDEIKKDYRYIYYAIKALLTGAGTQFRASEVAKVHFDIGNELFERMLDKSMMYTCAYWQGANTLDQAQENKLELICRKLSLEPGMRVLDIGCGWGGFAEYAAEKYKVDVVGVTISQEQLTFARESLGDLPIEYRLQDYRDVDEKFDRIVAIGMWEHVTLRYHRVFMETVNRCLADDGLFLLQTVGRSKAVNRPDPVNNALIA